MRELIERLQEHYDTFEPKQKWILLILPILVIGGVAYFFYIDPFIQEIEEKRGRVAQLSQEIMKHSSRRYERMIFLKKREILSLQSEIDRLQNKMLTLKSELDRQRFIFLNGRNFAKLLEDMLKSSVQNGLELSQIKIEDLSVNSVGKLKIKKRMRIEGSGEFLNIVKFIRSLEAHPVLLRVDRFFVETNGSTPSFQTDIEFYGVEG